jgi:hypothetical protein
LSLLVKRAQGGFQEIPIRLPQFLIGRDPDCHLRPVSPLVSKTPLCHHYPRRKGVSEGFREHQRHLAQRTIAQGGN